MDVPASYFDGRVSVRREITIRLDGDTLYLVGPGVEKSYPIDHVKVSPAVGSVRRAVRLPNGGLCEVMDMAFIETLERRQGRGRFSAQLHRWEWSLPLAGAALLITVVTVFLFMHYAVPALARHVAYALPVSAEASLGRESLSTLDRFVCKPSKLSEKRRSELTALFKRMVAPLPEGRGYRIEFRSSEQLGANAFALPSGIVVVTDDLVELAKNDNEITGVLAHELGHVRGRHLLRHFLQTSVAGLLMAAVTGDVLSVTSLSATLPAALVDAKFSRNFEREADDAAVACLKANGIPLSSYAEMLSRLQAQLDTKTKGEAKSGGVARNYLSTHPDTGERVRRIMAREESGATGIK